MGTPGVRATRVEIKAGAIRAVHQHDDVEFHLFIPLMGTLQLTIGSGQPVDAPVGQAFYIKGGTPHGFRNLGSTPGAAMEIFVTEGASAASLDNERRSHDGQRTPPGTIRLPERVPGWSETRLRYRGENSTDDGLASDGKRGDVPADGMSGQTRTHPTLLLNFFDELRRHAPTGK